jgi:hypothetical protein
MRYASLAVDFAMISAITVAVARVRKAVARSRRVAQRHLCHVVRDLYGTMPFRPTIIPRSVLVWNDGAPPRLAQAIYEERAFDRLPILADALEETGRTQVDILDHLRSGGEHYRGCWVVDAVLKKE